jgi:hypothetical protein
MLIGMSPQDPPLELPTTGQPTDVAAVDLCFTTVQEQLDVLAAQLRDLWVAVMATGDLEQVTRLVEASHGVQRASVALRAGTLVPARAEPVDHPTRRGQHGSS